MTHKQQNVLVMLLSSLILGITTDVLLRQDIFGLNFLLWSLLWSAIAFCASLIKRVFSPLLGVHIVLTILNALLVYIRSEPIVQVWSVLLTLTFLGLSFGRLFIVGFSSLSLTSKIIEWLSSPILGLIEFTKDSSSPPSSASRRNQLSGSVVGIAIAIPLVLTFIGLFASSDEIFRSSFSWLGDFFSAIGEFLAQFNIGRLITILFWTGVSLSWIGVVVYRRLHPVKITIDMPKLLKQRDASVVLASVIVVFAFYVLIQLRYLFSGASLPDGISFASYARRGYGELLLATLLASSIIYLICRTVKPARQHSVLLLSNILIVLNSIVVLSAWRRLSLYEDAYGWTMTRFVARMGLVCILLGSLSLFMWVNSKIRVAQLYRANWYIIGMVLTVSAVLNPVGLVTERNLIDRPSREVPLDVIHMLSQSPDSYPSICANAQILMNSYPDEYKTLRDRSVQEDNIFYGTYPYDDRASKGLSAHMVHSKAYKDKYHNCLP